VLLLEPESAMWPLLTGVLDGWLVLHATGRVMFANQHATWLLGSSGRPVGPPTRRSSWLGLCWPTATPTPPTSC
jgi:hypothetical protein